MSTHPRTAPSANADQRLSQLIKLKRLEKPDAAFWESFEQEFRSRQLTTFVHIQPMHTRLRKACMILARKAAPPVAAAGAVALTFFAATNARYLANDSGAAAPPGKNAVEQPPEKTHGEAYFIVDATEESGGAGEQAASDTIYQINALSSVSGSSAGYQLHATPVTFSQGAGVGQPSGANVLSKQPNY